MKNFIQKGEVVTVTAPATVASGDLVTVGLLVGVAVHDAASGSPVEIQTTGVFRVKKATSQAWATVGLAIYVVPGTGTATTATTAGNVLIGTNVETELAAAAIGTVRLNGSAPAAVTS
jgi:predicted RecA/RadA family phage recombinase